MISWCWFWFAGSGESALNDADGPAAWGVVHKLRCDVWFLPQLGDFCEGPLHLFPRPTEGIDLGRT
jgi:hypothetical protein